MSKKGRDTNKRNLGTLVAGIVVGAVGGWVAIAVVVGLITMRSSFELFAALLSGLTDYRVWTFYICAVGGVVIAVVAQNMRSGKRVLKVNDIEDSHWLTHAEVVKSENMTVASYSKLGDVADGVPVYARKQGRDITVVFAKAIHSLIVGTTRSGKTTTFVDPTVQILCRTKTKPSMLITDPKGELYRHHAATLKAQGYEVRVLDVSDPYRSARWNPFAAVIEKTRQMREAMDADIRAVEVVQKGGKYIDLNGVVHTTFEQAEQANKKLGQYAFGGKNYPTAEQANTARRVYVQDLKDEILVDIQDIIQTICPITDHQQPVWEQGARDFINALAIAMWEDLVDGGCVEQAFNLHTLYKNVADYAKDELEVLREYITAGRDEFSQAEGRANAVLTSQEKQLSSFLSQVNNYMTQFSDSGIRRLTSGNDIEMSAFDEKPTVLFVIFPDEKENRHFLVTLLVTQLYKTLVNKARHNYRRGETKDEELKRNVYLIMDEFGNLPKFPNIRKIMAVGASRKIFMLPIIQSYAQLNVIYGKDEAAIIRDNSNIKIFIGSNDTNTIEEFSKLCGKTKQRHISFGDGVSSSSFNVNTSAESVPLIYPSELEHLNDPPKVMGNAIVLAFGKNPIRSKYESVFQTREIYKPVNEVLENPVEPQVFDERAHYYNFASRSVYIARSNEFMAQQQAEAMRTAGELMSLPEPEPPEPFDPMNGADERLLPLMLGIKEQLNRQGGKRPKAIAIVLESAFFDHDMQKLIRACTSAMTFAKPLNLRWLYVRAAKLKNIIQQLAARQPLEITEQQGDLDNENTKNDDEA